METPTPIAGASDYAVTTDGGLWSKRIGPQNRTGEWKRLADPKPESGYRFVSIRLDNGKWRSTVVHKLVLETFVGPPPVTGERMYACHIDDVQENNRLDNLRWGTRLENAADALRNGKVPSGERHANCLYPTSTVVGVRTLCGMDWEPYIVALLFDCTITFVSGVKSGRIRQRG